MQSTSRLFDIDKFVVFRSKNADVSRTLEVCQEIHILFGLSLCKVQLCQVSPLQDMCDKF